MNWFYADMLAAVPDPLACPSGFMCTNIGGFRDCCLGTQYCTAIVAFSTACVDWDHAACLTSRPGTRCWYDASDTDTPWF